MIPNEAVEAAAWAYVRALPGYVEGVSEAPLPREVNSIRAALEAALPHLLACQRSGAGHSADALAPDVVRLVIFPRKSGRG